MSSQYDNAGSFRMVARVAGSILAGFFLLAFVPKLVSSLLGESPMFPEGREWEGQVMLAMFVMYILGYAISWWRPLWGGVLICCAAFVVSVPFIILQRNTGSLIFAIPQLFVGVFFLAAHFVEVRDKREPGDTEDITPDA